MSTRRRPPLKWQPLAPPTPRVLNFPRRHVVRTSANNKRGVTTTTGKLEALFDEERTFGNDDVIDVPVVVLNAGGGDRDSDVAGVESEMLRAECRFLRMERELALKKVKRNRARMERLLCSVLQTLITGREKMAVECECGTLGSVYESLGEEIEAIRSKLVDIRRISTTRSKIFEAGSDDRSFWYCIPREIQELAEASFATDDSISLGSSSRFTDSIARLSRTMNLSKVSSSASTSCGIEMPNLDSLHAIGQGYKEEGIGGAEEEQPCSERCRAVVRRVADQVRFETEQWSQVQDMLEKVKEEMEQLQACKDKWQQQALVSQDQIISLNSTVEAWKTRAISEETKVKGLQTQVEVLQEELKMVKNRARMDTSNRNLTQQKENHNLKNGNSGRHSTLREDKKKLDVLKRSPFLDIGNSSPLMRQITKVVFPNHKR